MGAVAFGIVAQGPKRVQDFMVRRGLSLPILVDPDRAVTKRYGVYHVFGLDAFRTARPSTFLIDRDGRIHFMYIGKSQHDRPDAKSIVVELSRLNA